MQVHPKELADTLKSVLEFTKDDHGHPDVMIDYSQATLAVVGVGRYNAARQTVQVEPGEGAEDACVIVPARLRAKTKTEINVEAERRGVSVEVVTEEVRAATKAGKDIINDLTKLASAVTPSSASGISSAKGNRVTVEIEDGTRLTILDGHRLVGELADSGSGAEMHEWLEHQLASTDWERGSGPLALSIETVSKLSKIKSDSTVVDLAVSANHGGHTAMLQCGTVFRGLITTVDRELFANGGPWQSGPGSTDKLLV